MEGDAPVANTPVDRVVFKTPIVKIGVLRCPIDHPSFRQPGPTHNYALVFPRAPVSVSRSDGVKFVADPTTVAVWNRGQHYFREPVSPRGAISDWFGLDGDVVLDVVRAHDASAENVPERPFQFSHVRTDPQLYLSQRRVLDTVLNDTPDALAVEESVLACLSEIVAAGYAQWRIRAWEGGHYRRSLQEEIVWRAEAFIGKHFREPLVLADIARAAGASPFHLCRLFREHGKSTLHARRTELRLRMALEYVLDTSMDLTNISLISGYSSHSHFTAAFRRHFGTTPSELRKKATFR